MSTLGALSLTQGEVCMAGMCCSSFCWCWGKASGGRVGKSQWAALHKESFAPNTTMAQMWCCTLWKLFLGKTWRHSEVELMQQDVCRPGWQRRSCSPANGPFQHPLLRPVRLGCWVRQTPALSGHYRMDSYSHTRVFVDFALINENL